MPRKIFIEKSKYRACSFVSNLISIVIGPYFSEALPCVLCRLINMFACCQIIRIGTITYKAIAMLSYEAMPFLWRHRKGILYNMGLCRSGNR